MNKDEEIMNNKLNQPFLAEVDEPQTVSKFDFIYERIERWKRFYFRLTNGSTSGSVFCLLCITFGSGILALPYSFKEAGIILGTILFLVASACVYWTIKLLTKVAFRTNTINYSMLIYKYYGRNQVMIYELMNIIANFGGIIVYQQIISNFFLSFLDYCGLNIIKEYPKLSRFIQMTSFSIFMQTPICLVKNIDILHKLSMYGTFALLYTVLVALFEFPFYIKQSFSLDRIKYFDINLNAVSILCMYFFAYANHNAVLNVLNEVKEPTKAKGNRIVNIAFYIEFLTYLIVIFSGYLSTLDNTNEIFIDREGQSIFLLIGKQLYIVSLTCHIGLYYFISRPSIEMFINKGQRFTEKENTKAGYVTMIGLNFIAYYFTSISSVISIIGATADIYLVFVMPIMLYLVHKPKRDWKRYWSIFVLIISLFIGGTHLLSKLTITIVNII